MIKLNNRLEIAKDFADNIKSDNIKQIILFGSVARGDDDEESDIDILIISPIADDLTDDIMEVVTDIVLEKKEIISPLLMTDEHFNKTKNYPFLTNVLKEGVVIG